MKRVLAIVILLALVMSGCAAPREELPVLDATPKQEPSVPAVSDAPSAPFEESKQMSANEAIESGTQPDPEKEIPFEEAAFEAPPTILETAPPADIPEMPTLPVSPDGSGTGDGNEETQPPEPAEPTTPPAEPTQPPATDPTQPTTPPDPETPPVTDPAPPPAPDVDYRFALGQNVDYNTVYNHLYAFTKQIGSRRVGTDGNYNARQYILNQLSSWGFSESNGSMWKQDFYSTGNLYTENIVASIPGNGTSSTILVLSAHFDSVRDTVGAIDNASGAAALLEAARVIKQSGMQYNFEIRFCFFSAEEDGYKGAYEYIRRQGSTELANHIVFNVDMAGYANDGRPHALVVSTKGDPSTSDWSSAQPNVISGSIVKAYYMMDMNYARYYSPTNAGKHDIVPFYARGIPCATLSLREIDFKRAYGNDLGIAAPWLIHTWDDTLERLNIDSVVEVCQLMITSTAFLNEAYA